MEKIQNAQEKPLYKKTQEAIFAEIVHKALNEFKRELQNKPATVTEFFANGRRYEINNLAAAVMGVGQLGGKLVNTN